MLDLVSGGNYDKKIYAEIKKPLHKKIPGRWGVGFHIRDRLG